MVNSLRARIRAIKINAEAGDGADRIEIWQATRVRYARRCSQLSGTPAASRTAKSVATGGSRKLAQPAARQLEPGAYCTSAGSSVFSLLIYSPLLDALRTRCLVPDPGLCRFGTHPRVAFRRHFLSWYDGAIALQHLDFGPTPAPMTTPASPFKLGVIFPAGVRRVAHFSQPFERKQCGGPFA